MLPPSDLPVEESVPELCSALADSRSAVLQAPPGSGKTTIVPLRLVNEDWLERRKILVLEPRRLAARAAARRMAFLLGEEVGETVGYVTRTDRRVGSGTRVEVVTEGILTRRLQRDPELPDTGLVVFDEFHERNLNTDLGMALCLEVRATIRPDLRLLVMSATVDAEQVAGLLDDAPVISSATTAHPVEIRWEPGPRQSRLEQHAVAVIRQSLARDEGDLLVFLPGIGEINRVRAGLTGTSAAVHRLHGSLGVEEQDAAITPGPTRKVVLATDIAETSLTVEGVRVVIDSGVARAPRFDARTGMTRLRTVPISKASADQRAGRAGRTEPGVAYRLWSKVEHGPRKQQIVPEITQVDLAGFALQLAVWGTAGPDELRFIDPPPRRSYQEGVRLLEQLGALEDGRITPAGRAMADLPLHPRLAHMVVTAGPDRWLACLLSALLDERDILRGRPDEIPADLAERVVMLDQGASAHPALDGRVRSRVLRSASEIGRRAGITPAPVDPDRTGPVLALAFPDRLAVQRGSPGRFQLRTGTSAWVSPSDPLATQPFVVVADLDGKRKDARIRLAAPLAAEEVVERYAHEVEESIELEWRDERLLERRTTRLGGMILKQEERRATPGPEATAAVLERLRSEQLRSLPWSDAAIDLQARVEFLRTEFGEPWPDWSMEKLVDSMEDWLVPYLGLPTGFDRFYRLDLASILRGMLDHRHLSRLDRLAPSHVEVPSGRRIKVDYSGDKPSISVRVQEMFGTDVTPTVGARPLVLELLSPAQRPIQVTSDLGGFWSGSWEQVRKEMAGRYPKHDWPVDPAGARPSR